MGSCRWAARPDGRVAVDAERRRRAPPRQRRQRSPAGRRALPAGERRGAIGARPPWSNSWQRPRRSLPGGRRGTHRLGAARQRRRPGPRARRWPGPTSTTSTPCTWWPTPACGAGVLARQAACSPTRRCGGAVEGRRSSPPSPRPPPPAGPAPAGWSTCSSTPASRSWSRAASCGARSTASRWPASSTARPRPASPSTLPSSRWGWARPTASSPPWSTAGCRRSSSSPGSSRSCAGSAGRACPATRSTSSCPSGGCGPSCAAPGLGWGWPRCNRAEGARPVPTWPSGRGHRRRRGARRRPGGRGLLGRHRPRPGADGRRRPGHARRPRRPVHAGARAVGPAAAMPERDDHPATRQLAGLAAPPPPS